MMQVRISWKDAADSQQVVDVIKITKDSRGTYRLHLKDGEYSEIPSSAIYMINVKDLSREPQV